MSAATITPTPSGSRPVVIYRPPQPPPSDAARHHAERCTCAWAAHCDDAGTWYVARTCGAARIAITLAWMARGGCIPGDEQRHATALAARLNSIYGHNVDNVGPA